MKVTITIDDEGTLTIQTERLIHVHHVVIPSGHDTRILYQRTFDIEYGYLLEQSEHVLDMISLAKEIGFDLVMSGKAKPLPLYLRTLPDDIRNAFVSNLYDHR